MVCGTHSRTGPRARSTGASPCSVRCTDRCVSALLFQSPLRLPQSLLGGFVTHVLCMFCVFAAALCAAVDAAHGGPPVARTCIPSFLSSCSGFDLLASSAASFPVSFCSRLIPCSPVLFPGDVRGRGRHGRRRSLPRLRQVATAIQPFAFATSSSELACPPLGCSPRSLRCLLCLRSHMCNELQSDALPLFVRCPNFAGHGDNKVISRSLTLLPCFTRIADLWCVSLLCPVAQEKYVPSPASKSSLHLSSELTLQP